MPDSLDQIVIHLNPTALAVLNFCLAFLLFGVSLEINLSDFRDLLKKPKPALVTLTGQLIIVPAIALAIVFIFSPLLSIGLGLLLVSACPGGNISNYTTHLAKGRVTLAITTTSISTLAACITTPLIFGLGSQWIPGTASIAKDLQVPPIDMVLILIKLILLPLILGIILNKIFPEFILKIKPWIKRLSLVIFFSFIVAALAGNRDHIQNHLMSVFWYVLLLNGLALAAGYLFARITKLPEADVRAVTFETGIHNTALGLILVFNFFKNMGGMAMVLAWYGIWDLVTAFALARYWAKKGISSIG